jgi:hypothetical protein
MPRERFRQTAKGKQQGDVAGDEHAEQSIVDAKERVASPRLYDD